MTIIHKYPKYHIGVLNNNTMGNQKMTRVNKRPIWLVLCLVFVASCAGSAMGGVFSNQNLHNYDLIVFVLVMSFINVFQSMLGINLFLYIEETHNVHIAE